MGTHSNTKTLSHRGDHALIILSQKLHEMDQLASPWLNCWQGQQSTLFSVSSTLPSTSAFFQCPRGRRRPSRLPPVVSTTGAVANASRTRATAWSPSAASCDAQNAMSITFVDREKYCAAIRTLLPTGPTSTHANVTAGPIHMPKLCKEGKCARVDRGADCVHPIADQEASVCAMVALLAAACCGSWYDGEF